MWAEQEAFGLGFSLEPCPPSYLLHELGRSFKCPNFASSSPRGNNSAFAAAELTVRIKGTICVTRLVLHITAAQKHYSYVPPRVAEHHIIPLFYQSLPFQGHGACHYTTVINKQTNKKEGSSSFESKIIILYK